MKKKRLDGPGAIDRILTGESDPPVNVMVDVIERRSDAFIEHNLKYVNDFTSIDFFMPLILLFAIFALQIVDIIGLGMGIVIFLQFVLVRDLFARMKRRSSGRMTVGFVPPFSQADWGKALVIYLALLPVAIAGAWLNRLLLLLLFPVLAGMAASLSGAAADPAPGGLDQMRPVVIILFFISTVVFAPITEELWFRGIGLSGFMKTGGRLRALAYTSLIFAVLHGPLRIFDCTVLGAAFAWIRFRTGSLYCSITMHALHNFVVLVIMVLF